MDRALELRLLRDALEPAEPTGDEVRVPVEVYLDPTRHEREVAAWHRSRMGLAAHGSELPGLGDFVTREVLGQPALLVRGDDGQARAFLNVCRHRGARVELRSHGNCTRFVCPYHAWTYGRDGSLASIRLPQAFPNVDVDELGLTPLSCAERGGLIWVGEPGLELDKHLAGLLDEVEGLGPEDATLFAWTSREWGANWKLLVEGGIESYHFRIAHKATVGPLFVDTGSQYEMAGPHFRLVLPRRTLASLRDVAPSEWRLVEHANVLYTLAPNASILVQDGHYALIVMTPVAVDRTRIDIATVGRPATSDKARAFLQANHDFTVRTLEEDFVLAEQIQAGMASGANTHVRFGRFEQALRDLHAALDEAL